MPDQPRLRTNPREQVILGAGLSGLSLAIALLDRGIKDPITIVDRRTTFGRDHTWSTWLTPGLRFADLASHRWERWRVAGVTAASPRHPYVHIASEAFYDYALGIVERAPNVELRLDEAVTAVGDGWAETAAGRLTGTVHDGLGLGSPRLKGVEVELWQRFLGWEVETRRPAFDPAVATLMDFEVEQDGAVQFVYTLPFSPTRALVEHTSFAPGALSSAKRRQALERYLEPHDYEILHEERGSVPMTAARLPARRGERTSAIGTAGGAVRPSSGYAFSRIQAHVTAVADAVATGRPLPARAGHPRRTALDHVFLKALRSHPAAFPSWTRRMAERLPGDVFARFMVDASTPADELRVMAALPPAPFLRAAMRG